MFWIGSLSLDLAIMFKAYFCCHEFKSIHKLFVQSLIIIALKLFIMFSIDYISANKADLLLFALYMQGLSSYADLLFKCSESKVHMSFIKRGIGGFDIFYVYDKICLYIFLFEPYFIGLLFASSFEIGFT